MNNNDNNEFYHDDPNFILLVNINNCIKEYKYNKFIKFKQYEKYKSLGLFYFLMCIFVNNFEYQEEDVLLMLSYDKKMRLQYKYSKKHTDVATNDKIENIKILIDKYQSLVDYINNDIIIDKNLTRNNIIACITKIMLLYGIRVAKMEHFNKLGTIGLTTIQNKNIKSLNPLILNFVGKKKVQYEYKIIEKDIINIINLLYNKNDPEGFVFDFENKLISYIDINNYLKKIINEESISSKDLRTLVSNLTFLDNIIILYKESQSKNNINLDKIIKLSIAKTSEKLQNTKTVAKKSYIFNKIINFLNENINDFNNIIKNYKNSHDLLKYILNL